MATLGEERVPATNAIISLRGLVRLYWSSGLLGLSTESGHEYCSFLTAISLDLYSCGQRQNLLL